MNEILQPLRVHDSLNYLLAKRHEALKYNVVVPLVADRNKLLPFCIVQTPQLAWASQLTVTICEAINYNTGKVHNIMPYMTFFHGLDDMTNPNHQYILYSGNSSLSPLPQGIYYLRIVQNTKTWYIGPFKVGFFTNTTTFEWYTSNPFGHAWMKTPLSIYYKAVYNSFTYDSGEVLEYSEVQKNRDNYEIPTYQRSDKLRNVVIFGDSDALDCMRYVAMISREVLGTVYLTDEVGKRSIVEITDVEPTGIGNGNYLQISVKYRVKANSIISVNKTPVLNHFRQDALIVYEPTTVGLTFGDEPLVFGNEPLTFNGE